MNELALFAGAGGGLLGGRLLGWTTVCAVERDAYAAQVLAQRQNDGILEAFPIWSDVTTFDGKPWSRIVDIISGGFPCQDISVAGKGAGIEGERSGMWKEFLRIICDIQPRFVWVENSPMLTSRGLGVVLGDLAEAGYDTEWTCLSAAEVGANHMRDRIWILAVANTSSMQSDAGTNNREHGKSIGEKPRAASGEIPYPYSAQLEGDMFAERIPAQHANINSADWWKTEPEICRVVDGLASRMDFVNDQLKAIGNGQVPLCVARAFQELAGRFGMVKLG